MKPVIYALVGLSSLGVGAHAQSTASPLRPAKAAERQAAVLSIQTQLNAFARDDYKTAIIYQSAGLKKNFASPDAFRTMIIRAYPEFAHFKSVQFGAARADTTGNHVAIPVAVTGRDGITVRALYFLVRENKTYRIEGVHGGVQAPPDRADGVSGMDI